MFLQRLLVRFGPAPGAILDRFGPNKLLLSYAYYYGRAYYRVIAWHSAQLEKLDRGIFLRSAIDKLMQARSEARLRGVGPMDPEYPTLRAFYPETSNFKTEE